MHASRQNADRAPCGMRHAAHTFNQRCAASIVADDAPDGTEGYSGILGCWTASMQRAQWLVQHSLRECRVASASVRHYETG
jgi:hypothetical protein